MRQPLAWRRARKSCADTMMTGSVQASFFISYTKSDRDWALWIAWTLESKGYGCIIQDRDFKPGTLFPEQMHRALRKADRLIAVLSPSYFDAKFTSAEWANAFPSQRLLPIRVTDFEPEGVFSSMIYVDLVDVDAIEAKRRLFEALRELDLTPACSPVRPIGHPREPTFPGGAARPGGSAARQHHPSSSHARGSSGAWPSCMPKLLRPSRARQVAVWPLSCAAVVLLALTLLSGPKNIADALTLPGEPDFPKACVASDLWTRARIVFSFVAGATSLPHPWLALPAGTIERRLVDARAALSKDSSRSLPLNVSRELLESIVADCYQSAEAHKLLGVALMRENRFAEAAQHFVVASTTAPNYIAPRLDLAIALLQQNEPQTALYWLEEVFARAPDHTKAFRLRAEARLRLGQLDDAIADFRTYLERVPSDGTSWWILSNALTKRDATAEAETAACRAVALGVVDAAARCSQTAR